MDHDELDREVARAVHQLTRSTPAPPAFEGISAAVPRRRTQNRWIAALGILVCVVLVVGGVAYAVARDDGSNPRVHVAPADDSTLPSTTEPAPLASCAPPTAGPADPPSDLTNATWSELPPGPADGRSQASYVWTGTEVIVFGGEITSGGSDGPRQRSGAAYNPANATWRSIAEAPIAPRSDHHAFWTGAEMLVWGGNEESWPNGLTDGAAYDPVLDAWRVIPKAPLEAWNTAAEWTGQELVVWDTRNAGAAYDPCRNQWRTIACAPDGLLAGAAHGTISVWTGSEMIVWAGSSGLNVPFVEAAAYDPAADSWRALAPAPGLPLFQPDPVWSGSEMLVWGWSNVAVLGVRSDEARALDPAIGEWREIAPPPLDTYEQGGGVGTPRLAWTGDRLLAWTGSLDQRGPLVVAYDPTTDRWAELAAAPVDFGYTDGLVWTGRQLLVFPGAAPTQAALAFGNP